MIDKYLPDWHENMNATAFDAYRYDGGVYAIPIGNKPTAGDIQYRMCKTGYHGCHRHGQYRNVRRPLPHMLKKQKSSTAYMRPTSWQMQLTSSEVPATAI